MYNLVWQFTYQQGTIPLGPVEIKILLKLTGDEVINIHKIFNTKTVHDNGMWPVFRMWYQRFKNLSFGWK